MAELIDVFERLHWNPVLELSSQSEILVASDERLLIHGAACMDEPQKKGELELVRDGHDVIWSRDLGVSFARWRQFERADFGAEVQRCRESLIKKWQELDEMTVRQAAGEKGEPSLGFLDHIREELERTSISLTSFHAACVGPMYYPHVLPGGTRLAVRVPDHSPSHLRITLVLSRIRSVGKIQAPSLSKGSAS